MSKKESQKKWYEKHKVALLQKREQQLLNIEGKRYKGFIVRDDGTIKNKFGNVIGTKKLNGYITVTLNGKQLLAHRIVWEAFNGEIPEGMEIDHINAIRNDNRLENLRLTTPKENRNNPHTIEHYKQSNKNKPHTKLNRMKSSMNMWFQNLIRQYHKNGNKYIFQD